MIPNLEMRNPGGNDFLKNPCFRTQKLPAIPKSTPTGRRILFQNAADENSESSSGDI